MRLKHSSAGPLPSAAVETARLNFTIWDTIRSDKKFILETEGATLSGPVADKQYRLDNQTSPSTPGAASSARRVARTVPHANILADNFNGNECHGAVYSASPRSCKYRSFRDDGSCSSSPTSPRSSSASSSSSSSTSRSSSSASSPGVDSSSAKLTEGIVNPNYPGFEHLAAKLLKLAAGSDGEDDDEEGLTNNNNNNNNCDYKKTNNINNNYYRYNDEEDINIDVSQADSGKGELYDKPKLAAAMADAFLSSAKEDLTISRDFACKQARTAKTAKVGMAPGVGIGVAAKAQRPTSAPVKLPPRHFKDSNRAHEDDMAEETEEEEKFNKEATEKEQQAEPRADPRAERIVPRKKEKMAVNQQVRKGRAAPGERGDRRFVGSPASANAGHKKRSSLEVLGGFDVYNIETAMPRIDLDLIESHLRAAKEEERRRRNDREEIRRRLAMGSEDADYFSHDPRPGKKPSLQARLQSGMNLQICFMNETLSDTESPGSESEVPGAGSSVVPASSKSLASKIQPTTDKSSVISVSSKPIRPLSLPLRLDGDHEWRDHSSLMTEADFLARQAQLQAEARMALAQAKDMAHMQMEIERQRQNASPITEMVRCTLQKVGVSFPEDRRRLSRQILTDMNVAQLQVIVNDLHTQIEYLNESLVRYLMERDDLHMEQDSMLVDIEDLTRYLGAKEQSGKGGPMKNNNNLLKSNGSSASERVNTKK